MPLFLRALAKSGKQSLSLIDQATSRFFDILHTAIQHTSSPAPSSETAEGVHADATASIDIEEGLPLAEDVSHSTEAQDSSLESAESSDSDRDDESIIVGESLVEHTPEPEEQPQGAAPEHNMDVASSVASPTVRSPARRVPPHPYMYSAAPFASGSANISEHLDSSPVRSHRDFIAPDTRTPSPPPPTEFPYLPTLSLPQAPPSASASRPRKRSRGSDGNESSASDSESESDPAERPRMRRRLSIPHPACRREPCFARHLPLLNDGPAALPSDDEDTWSTAAQASDTEPDLYDTAFFVPEVRGEKRPREDEEDSGAERGPSSKRRRSAN